VAFRHFSPLVKKVTRVKSDQGEKVTRVKK
jgi:hypothetical protein